MVRLSHFALLSVALLIVCGFHQIHRTWRIGEKGPKGQLVIFVVKRAFHVPIFLQDDYGVMIANDGNEQKPLPRFVLACRKTATVFQTTDFARFKAEMFKLPKGTKVREYETCSVHRRYGLRQRTIDAYYGALKRCRVLELNISCYCEATG